MKLKVTSTIIRIQELTCRSDLFEAAVSGGTTFHIFVRPREATAPTEPHG